MVIHDAALCASKVDETLELIPGKTEHLLWGNSQI